LLFENLSGLQSQNHHGGIFLGHEAGNNLDPETQSNKIFINSEECIKSFLDLFNELLQ
jgi:hypothetical protein